MLSFPPVMTIGTFPSPVNMVSKLSVKLGLRTRDTILSPEPLALCLKYVAYEYY